MVIKLEKNNARGKMKGKIFFVSLLIFVFFIISIFSFFIKAQEQCYEGWCPNGYECCDDDYCYDWTTTQCACEARGFVWDPSTNNCYDPCPTYSLSVMPQWGTIPFTVEFKVRQIENPGSHTYHWEFGDGSSSNQQEINHTFTTAGTFFPNVTVSCSVPGYYITDYGTPVKACGFVCNNGEKRCSGTQIQTCGDYNSDHCYEWGTPTNCPSGQTCINSQCQFPTLHCSDFPYDWYTLTRPHTQCQSNLNLCVRKDTGRNYYNAYCLSNNIYNITIS